MRATTGVVRLTVVTGDIQTGSKILNVGHAAMCTSRDGCTDTSSHTDVTRTVTVLFLFFSSLILVLHDVLNYIFWANRVGTVGSYCGAMWGGGQTAGATILLYIECRH